MYVSISALICFELNENIKHLAYDDQYKLF